MTNVYFALKLAHILGGTLLFGTGLGIAFFMWMAHCSGDAKIIAYTARTVVIADFIFTATAVVAQPLTGAALMHIAGYHFSEPWIVLSLALYVLTGICWLPVVWIQARLRRIAQGAAQRGVPLPAEYHRLFVVWFVLGWPAFLSVIAIFAVMIWKPQLW